VQNRKTVQKNTLGNDEGKDLPKLLVIEKHEGQTLENAFSEQDTNNISPLETADNTVTVSVLVGKKNSREERFDELLFEAIDQTLSSLGEPVKNTIYLHLQKDFNIGKNEIPQEIDKFLDIMHQILGLSASRLEAKFLKNLQPKINVDAPLFEYEWPLSKWIIMDPPFKERLGNMRRNFVAQNMDAPSKHIV
jgi:hypothetical protein